VANSNSFLKINLTWSSYIPHQIVLLSNQPEVYSDIKNVTASAWG